jgi:hypothetical protein
MLEQLDRLAKGDPPRLDDAAIQRHLATEALDDPA